MENLTEQEEQVALEAENDDIDNQIQQRQEEISEMRNFQDDLIDLEKEVADAQFAFDADMYTLMTACKHIISSREYLVATKDKLITFKLKNKHLNQ